MLSYYWLSGSAAAATARQTINQSSCQAKVVTSNVQQQHSLVLLKCIQSFWRPATTSNADFSRRKRRSRRRRRLQLNFSVFFICRAATHKHTFRTNECWICLVGETATAAAAAAVVALCSAKFFIWFACFSNWLCAVSPSCSLFSVYVWFSSFGFWLGWLVVLAVVLINKKNNNKKRVEY